MQEYHFVTSFINCYQGSVQTMTSQEHNQICDVIQERPPECVIQVCIAAVRSMGNPGHEHFFIEPRT